jgi:phage shock protein A
MLDRAEDPEKMIRLMIREMEDTLVEIKASCAGTMAQVAKGNRELADLQEKLERWTERAQLAVSKGKEDLAREALMEKRAAQKRLEVVQEENTRLQEVVQHYKKDMGELEAKLEQARNKHKSLIQRHVRAQQSVQAQSQIRKINTQSTMLRFDKFEQRIERMEADADLVNYGAKGEVVDRFAALERDDEIEAELRALKEKRDQVG